MMIIKKVNSEAPEKWTIFEPQLLKFTQNIISLSQKNCFFKIIYSFIYEQHWERDRDLGRGRSRLLAGNPMWDSILDPGITTWTDGSCSTDEPPRRPDIQNF